MSAILEAEKPAAPPVAPYWFKQRQARAEPAGNNVYKLTAPNLDEASITIRQHENGLWSAHLFDKGGQELAATPPSHVNAFDAWYAAFELYRLHLIV